MVNATVLFELLCDQCCYMHIEIMHYIVLCGYNVIKLLYPMVC